MFWYDAAAHDPELHLAGRLVHAPLTLRDVLPGAFIERRCACGRSDRRSASGRLEDRHPQWNLSLVVEGKPRLIRLPAALAEQARRGVQLHRRFQELAARQADIERHRAKAAGRYNPVYAAMVESLDESVGEILRTIEEAGLADRTMVVVTSDNGGLHYEGTSKEQVTDNSPWRAGKGHLYEGGIRVALLVRAPGVVKPGTVISIPVSSIDLLPTFCDWAGIPVQGVDGVSLMPVFRGRRLPERALFWHYPHYSNQGGEPASAIRLGPWKLIEFYDRPRRELYHLGKDPAEQVNLVEREPAVARRLAARLHRWLKSTGAVLPERNPAHDPSWPGWGLTGAEKPTPPAR